MERERFARAVRLDSEGIMAVGSWKDGLIVNMRVRGKARGGSYNHCTLVSAFLVKPNAILLRSYRAQ